MKSRKLLAQAILMMITIAILTSFNFAHAYIPDVGPDVCAFRCNEATQLCAPGCPPRPSGGGDGGGGQQSDNNGGGGGGGWGDESQAPGPIFFGFMFVAVIIVVFIFRGRQLPNAQAPQNQPPANTTTSPEKDKPKTEEDKAKDTTNSKQRRKFRPSYFKRIWKNKSGGNKMGKM